MALHTVYHWHLWSNHKWRRKYSVNCRQPERPTILHSRLLLCMHGMYVAMIHLDLHQEWMTCIKHNLIERLFLSHKTYTKHQRVLEKKLFFSETWIATLMCMVSDKYYLNELILEQKKRKKRKWKWKKNEHDGTSIAELEMFE